MLKNILKFLLNYKIFISYVDEDFNIAEDLGNFFRKYGFDVFISKISLQHGSKWKQEIKYNIRNSNLFVFVLSRKSLKSLYAISEAGHAWFSGMEIIPIKVNKSNFKNEELGWLADYNIADYNNKREFETKFRKKFFRIYVKRAILWLIVIIILIFIAFSK